MSTLRSQGWTLRPPFVAGGPTNDVALWCDESGITQLAGDPLVAWQTPWSEVRDLALTRQGRALELAATIADVRYTWRHPNLDGFEEWREVVLARGGVVNRRRRPTGVLIVVLVVLVASFGGAIGAWWNRGSAGTVELNDARAANVTLNDLPSGWYATSNSLLGYLVPPSGDVLRATPTTLAPRPGSIGARTASVFQHCFGVSNARDRLYGAAGQQPDYQVSSPVFATTTGTTVGLEVATTSQYYHSRSMVRRDVAEMSRKNFGACFAASSRVLVLAGFGLHAGATTGENWTPQIYAHAFVRGGAVALGLPGATGHLTLVMAVVAAGHYEVTLSAVTSTWPASRSILDDVLNTVASRITSTSARAL